MNARTLRPGQRSRVRVWHRDGTIRTVFESTTQLLEAPNWTPDGALILNGDGLLWELAADGVGAIRPLESGPVDNFNNDHVVSPDGTLIYASANDGHIWQVPREGGEPRQVTSMPDTLHFLHGISPDGSQLAYVRLLLTEGSGGARIHTIGVDGLNDRMITDGQDSADGPEWSPDGEWLYFNTEAFSAASGHAQIARVPHGGGSLEQLTFDERVNWFPHLAPSGDLAVYLSYPPGTLGHPADLQVEIRVVRAQDWSARLAIIKLYGGQGTINVPSWAPDGSAFAFVDYPLDEDPQRIVNAELARARNVETVREFYQSERDRDLDTWRSFWHAEGKQSFPSLGADATVSGLDALTEATREKFTTRPHYGIADRVEAFANPARVFAALDLEFPGEPSATIWCIFTFDDSGLVVEIEEIFDSGGESTTAGSE